MLLQKWHSIATNRFVAGKQFAEDNFLSWKTLEMIGDLKHQYLDLLVDIGFARLKSDVRKRYRGDRVLEVIQSEVNIGNKFLL